MADDDAALLDELVALLGDADEWPLVDGTPPAGPASRSSGGRSQQRPSALLGGQSGIGILRAEVARLTAQLHHVRQSQSSMITTAMEERHRRRRAETENEALREAVFRHTQFIRGLRAFVATTPPFSVTVDVCRYLHRHARLPRDRTIRWGEYNRLSLDTRLDKAIDMLCRETQGISIADTLSSGEPFVQCEGLDDRSSHGVTFKAVYTIDTDDIPAVARAACVAIRDLATICSFDHPLCVSRDVIEADTPQLTNTLYRVMGILHDCPFTDETVLVETHLITTYRVVHDHAVVLWDFIDEDECHPTAEVTNVVRESTGACLIRRERCSDGVERTVFRSLSTKKFRFHGASAQHTNHHMFMCLARPVDVVRVDELLFRRIVLQQLDAERAALVRGLPTAATRH